VPISYDSDGPVTRTIVFDGETYTAGTQVATDLEVHYASFGWIYEFINTDDGMFKIGTVLDAKVMAADVSLESSATPMSPAIDESEQSVIGLPTVGVALDFNPVKMVNIFGEISGMSGGSYGHFVDGEIGIKLIPVRNVSIVGGYRLIDVRVEDSSNFAELRISGPFVGATIRF
jgi:hypothetical protein